MRKKCELCGGAARMYCESDQASLCWDCDEKVHGANFLVAKHTRCLLCQACQSLTPWKASGPKLGPTVSVCDACVSPHSTNLQQQRDQRQESNSHDYNHDGDGDVDDDESDDVDDEESDDEDEDEEEEDEDEEDEDADNQVVPWSGNSPSSLPPPPPVVSSSSSMSSSEEPFSHGGLMTKRMRENSDLLFSDDEIGCSSSQLVSVEATSLRPMKKQRTTELSQSMTSQDHGEAESRSMAIISSLKRLQKEVITDAEGTSSIILGIYNMSGDHSR